MIKIKNKSNRNTLNIPTRVTNMLIKTKIGMR